LFPSLRFINARENDIRATVRRRNINLCIRFQPLFFLINKCHMLLTLFILRVQIICRIHYHMKSGTRLIWHERLCESICLWGREYVLNFILGLGGSEGGHQAQILVRLPTHHYFLLVLTSIFDGGNFIPQKAWVRMLVASSHFERLLLESPPDLLQIFLGFQRQAELSLL
jgi:hypothetical protein